MVDDQQTLSIYGPQDPILGMRSYIDPLRLATGEHALLQNFRYATGVLKARGGQFEYTGAAIVANGTFLGAWTGPFPGFAADPVVVAYWDPGPSRVRFFRSTDLVTWSDVSATGGAYGDARFTENLPVTFGLVQQRKASGFDLVLVALNGKEYPRVIDLPASQTRVHEPIDATVIQKSNRAVYRWRDWFDIQSTVAGNITATDALGLEATVQGSSPDKYLQIRALAAALSSGDAVTIVNPAGTLDNPGQQFSMVVESTYQLWWYYLKVEVGDGASWTTVYDKGDTTMPMVVVPLDSGGKRYVVSFDASGVTTHNIDRVRLTWNDATIPAADQTLYVYCMALTGNVPGGAQYAISHYNAGTFAETPGIVLPSPVTVASPSLRANDYLRGDPAGEQRSLRKESGAGTKSGAELSDKHYSTMARLADMGGPVLKNARIPMSTLLTYTVDLYFYNPSSTDLAKGVDYVNVYRNDPGDDGFYWAAFTQTASYAAGWSCLTGTAGSLCTVPHTDTYKSSQLMRWRPMPTGLHAVMPKGGCIEAAQNRCFVGGVYDASASRREIWVSRPFWPFRFQELTTYLAPGYVDPESAYRVETDGQEVVAIAALAGNLLAGETVYAFGKESLFSIQNFRAVRLTQIGCGAPKSVVKHRDTLTWLDNDGHVRRIQNGGQVEMSRGVVEDKLSEIPAARRVNAWGVTLDDKYAIAITPAAGSTNALLLVFDERSPRPYTDLLASPVTAEGMLAWNDQGARKWLLFGSNARVYRHDDPATDQDLGVNIACRIVTKEFSAKLWTGFTVWRPGVVTDDCAGGTASCVVTYKPRGVTQSFQSISLDVANPQTIRVWDVAAEQPTISPSGGRPSGASAQFDFAFGLRSGKRVLALEAELRQRPHEGPLAE